MFLTYQCGCEAYPPSCSVGGMRMRPWILGGLLIAWCAAAPAATRAKANSSYSDCVEAADPADCLARRAAGWSGLRPRELTRCRATPRSRRSRAGKIGRLDARSGQTDQRLRCNAEFCRGPAQYVQEADGALRGRTKVVPRGHGATGRRASRDLIRSPILSTSNSRIRRKTTREYPCWRWPRGSSSSG